MAEMCQVAGEGNNIVIAFALSMSMIRIRNNVDTLSDM